MVAEGREAQCATYLSARLCAVFINLIRAWNPLGSHQTNNQQLNQHHRVEVRRTRHNYYFKSSAFFQHTINNTVSQENNTQWCINMSKLTMPFYRHPSTLRFTTATPRPEERDQGCNERICLSKWRRNRSAGTSVQRGEIKVAVWPRAVAKVWEGCRFTFKTNKMTSPEAEVTSISYSIARRNSRQSRRTPKANYSTLLGPLHPQTVVHRLTAVHRTRVLEKAEILRPADLPPLICSGSFLQCST